MKHGHFRLSVHMVALHSSLQVDMNKIIEHLGEDLTVYYNLLWSVFSSDFFVAQVGVNFAIVPTLPRRCFTTAKTALLPFKCKLQKLERKPNGTADLGGFERGARKGKKRKEKAPSNELQR